MNHQCRAASLKQRVGSVAQSHVRGEKAAGGVAIGADFQIQQVAVVRPIRTIFSVLLSGWIEVPAGGLEVRAFALSTA